MIDDQFEIVDELESDYVRRRSDFLTVLCILTWVGCGITMIWKYYALSLLGFVSSFAQTSEVAWMKWEALIGLIMPLFCLAGSILMWNLRRIGFFIYLFGQAVPFVMSVYVALVVTKMNGGSMFFLVAGNIVPIAFTVMYALNLQHMRK